MGIAALAVAAALAATPAQFLQAQQRPDGSFAEPSGTPGPALTAWAVLGLRAAGAEVQPEALSYLVEHEGEPEAATGVALVLMAEVALGGDAGNLLARLQALPDTTVNAAIWRILALRAAGRPAPRTSVERLLARQDRSGGWSWAAGGAPDSNDTAAAIQALCAAGVSGKPVARGLAYLRRLQGKDGGFALVAGRGSDAQSTAWAVQAFLAASEAPPKGALAYLAQLRRPDGSFRYSARYAVTPVWVTAQVLPALARKPFPLRG